MDETKKLKEENKKITVEKEKIDYKSITIILGIAILLPIIIFLYKTITRDPNYYDYIIVGSGLYGATFNYLAKKRGKKTLVLERRNVVGGNVYCEKIEGIYVNKYGPHIFHTDNKTIWDFMNKLIELTPYQAQSVSKAKNKLYNFPYSMWTFNQLWGVTRPQEANMTMERQKYRGEIYDLCDQAISIIGKDIFSKFINESLQKEWWGRECDMLPPFIIPDLPRRYIYDTNFFFEDRYQGIPDGCYNPLFDILLNDTKVLLNTDYLKDREKYEKMADKIIFTGGIDEYYNYTYTPLEYRTVRWEHKIKDVSNFQGTAVIHYPDLKIPYSRVVEYKHFYPYNKEMQEKNKTVVSYEYYEDWNEDKECVYPINDERNNNIYLKYRELADKEKKVVFAGRLGTYKYYDMKDTIEEVFRQFNM